METNVAFGLAPRRTPSAKRRCILIGDSITAQNGLTTPGTAGNASIVSVSGVATVTHPSHQLVLGQEIWVYGSSVAEQDGFQTVASITDANTYTYNHGTGTGTADSVAILNPLRKVADGYFTFFNALSGAQYDVVRNYGKASAKTDTVITILNNHWQDDYADEAFVMIGINDVTNDVALATIQSQMGQIYDFVRNKGLFLNILTTLPMNTSHASFSAARMKVVHALVEWQKQYAMDHANCAVLDAHAAIVDPTSTTGSSTAYLLRDYLHPGEPGARAIGVKMVTDKFDGDTLQPAGRWPKGALDGYDNNTGSWNLLPNSMMLGTGGTVSPAAPNGPSGDFATGIVATHTIAAGSSFVGSIVARADGGNNQKAIFTATADNQTATLSYASIHAALTAGATYRLGANVKLYDISNLDYCFFEISMQGAGSLYSNVRALSQGASSFAAHDEFAEVTQDLWLESEEFVMPAGVTSAIVTLKLFSTAAGNCTVELGKPKFELVRY
jgi:lysophospholipase L1-like esterase